MVAILGCTFLRGIYTTFVFLTEIISNWGMCAKIGECRRGGDSILRTVYLISSSFDYNHVYGLYGDEYHQ